MFVAQYSLQYSSQYIFLSNSGIFLSKTLLYNILSTLYSRVLGNNILELGRKMLFIGKASVTERDFQYSVQYSSKYSV